MSADERAAELEAKIAESRAFWLAEAEGAIFRDHFVHRARRFMEAGRSWAAEARPWLEELHALGRPYEPGPR